MYIEGRNPVLEAVQSDKKISNIFLQHNIALVPKIKLIMSFARSKGIRVKKVSKKQLDRLSKTKNHQGIIAIMEHRTLGLQEVLNELDREQKTPFFVIINEVLYQYNLGAIIRNAECAGCTGIIISPNTKITAEAARASMGAIVYIPLISENIFNAIKILKGYAVKIVGLETSGEKTIYEENLKGSLAIVIGGEDVGISKSMLPKLDIVLKIPLFGKINSLNMSNALAITLFEKKRQEL